MPAEKEQFTIQINSHSLQELQEIAALYCMMKEKTRLFFEDNWLGDDRPNDIKSYWASLTDTERAIQILERTDAALYMEFYEKINNSIPKPPIQP